MSIIDFPAELLIRIASYTYSSNSRQAEDWCSFSLVHSRFRAAALKARLPEELVRITDDSESTVEALKNPSEAFVDEIRCLAITKKALRSSNSHLERLLSLSKNLHKLILAGNYRDDFPLTIVQGLLKALASAQPSPNLRILEIRKVSCFGTTPEQLLPIVPGPSGLEVIEIIWHNSTQNKSAPNASEAIAALIKPSKETLQRLKLNFLNLDAQKRFDLRMLVDDIVDKDADQQMTGDIHGKKWKGDDDRAWKAVKTLQFSINLNVTEEGSSNVAEVFRSFAEIFPNLGRLEFTHWPENISQMPRYTPEIIGTLSKLRNLYRLTLNLDFEFESKDTLPGGMDFQWYGRCLRRRYSVTEEIARVCFCLKRCTWVHDWKDDDGNSQLFRFVIVEGPNGKPGENVTGAGERHAARVSKAERSVVVKTKRDYFVHTFLKEGGELPGEIVGVYDPLDGSEHSVRHRITER